MANHIEHLAFFYSTSITNYFYNKELHTKLLSLCTGQIHVVVTQFIVIVKLTKKIMKVINIYF